MIRAVLTMGACALTLLAPGLAHAQTNPLVSEGWTFAAGPAVLVRPVYEGADAYEVTPLPGVVITYDDWLFVDPARGAGLQGDIFPGVRVAGGVDYMFGRDESDSALLRGMGDLDGGASAFGFLSLRPMGRVLSLDTRIETPFTGDLSGAAITTDVVGTLPFGEGLISLSAGTGWMTDGMMDDLFGVTPAQAASSTLPAYDPEGGLKAYRLGLATVHPLNDRWSIAGVVGYERLRGDAGDSPVVVSRDQVRTVFGALYRF